MVDRRKVARGLCVLFSASVLQMAGPAAAAQPPVGVFAKPGVAAEAMLADEGACRSEARYSRLVVDANLSTGQNYSVAAPLGMLVVAAMVSGRGARATPEEFVQNCMTDKGYVPISLQPAEAKSFQSATTPQTQAPLVEQLYATAGFEARRQAALADVEKKREHANALASSWVFGDVAENYRAPKHLELGPRDWQEITSSRLLPAVLTALDQNALSNEGRAPPLKLGAQLFQLAHQAHPTFCTTAPVSQLEQACLVDVDDDAKLDTIVLAKSLTAALPVLELEPNTAAALSGPVTVHQVAPEDCACQFEASLLYAGRRSMSRRDAGFEFVVTGNGASIHSPMFSLYLDDLPPTFDVMGARFENISRSDKTLGFDLTSGFEKGRAYDPYFGGTYVEWGF